MSADPTVVVHASADLLTAATAARLITALVDVQAEGRVPSVVLTGGGTGIGVLAHVQASPARDAVDWSRVEVFWGDERFLGAADPERNDVQARDALLDHLPLDPARVHAMAADDGPAGGDPDAAAAAYRAALDGRDHFDVLMLGVGPEGHVASIFPDSPAVRSTESATAVRDCPKPPPTRISLTLPSIGWADHVWLITAGAGKAEAVARAVSGADPVDVPAAGARGRLSTLWLIDRAAATDLPPH
ncbi:6-phosphogluconolactonase [Nakamurella flavida]|uniref:6-phosphogluconolactonase n=1 Tax=Nakamurella flavida TaxID=363630 RepID=A0A939C4D2_9ACTN|nr:6-phosphogluconolactonase [Nakamurella flavida]MBM9475112.1 6-phosphogluconolactonase [Nakamurella flavida]MDP9776682.1 6-phosphogluconolactonase [Nakamurella flavida]